jgi:uncharacterized membrane protein YbhN (UPF0104 family)
MSQSPFISVWYLFLGFLCTVIIVHLVCVIIAAILKRYAYRLQVEKRKQ